MILTGLLFYRNQGARNSAYSTILDETGYRSTLIAYKNVNLESLVFTDCTFSSNELYFDAEPTYDQQVMQPRLFYLSSGQISETGSTQLSAIYLEYNNQINGDGMALINL